MRAAWYCVYMCVTKAMARITRQECSQTWKFETFLGRDTSTYRERRQTEIPVSWVPLFSSWNFYARTRFKTTRQPDRLSINANSHYVVRNIFSYHSQSRFIRLTGLYVTDRGISSLPIAIKYLEFEPAYFHDRMINCAGIPYCSKFSMSLESEICEKFLRLLRRHFEVRLEK